MYATQDLRNEHEGIKVALTVLDRLADDLDEGRRVDAHDLDEIVDFLKTFADRCHHGKEEELLFPALEKAGVPRQNGPLGVMLTEHNQGREFIRTMSDSLPGVHNGDLEARKAFAAAVHGYVELLNRHIEKENTVLFNMAEQFLPAEEHARLSAGFNRIEQVEIGPGVHDRYHAMLDRLQEKYLKSQAA